MRVIEFSEFGGPEALQEVQRPEPAATAGRVRVRVAASTVNPVDWLTRAGALSVLHPHLSLPLVPGWDLAGTVLDDGEGFVAGQRVVGVTPWFAAGDGTYADVVLADPEWLAPLPDGVSDVDAATLPLNALTARQSLDLLKLTAGETLLVTGASGAVGGFAVQLAAADGVKVVAVASTGDEEWVSGLGATTVLGRGDAEETTRALRELYPDGVDAVLDAAPAGPAVIAAVRDGGRFVAVLDMTLPAPERDIEVAKVSSGPHSGQLTELAAALAEGRLRTRVTRTFPLAEVADAHRLVEAGGLRGKVVLTL